MKCPDGLRREHRELLHSILTEQVLTTATEVFSSATPSLRTRALAGDDVLFVGPGAYLIGGPVNDNINAYDHGIVVPGPGADTVAGSTCGTVIIYDVCEAASGENLCGGGDGTLITPVQMGALPAGFTVIGFSKIAIQPNSCRSSCVTKPNWSGHGSCI